MKSICTFILLLSSTLFMAQSDYGTPTNEPLPEKIQNLPRSIDVLHFPKENDPIKIGNRYYWKHMTSILCKESDITITEYGAYVFYNGKWNLRRVYPIKELDKTFGTKKQKMNQAEPYTWTKNYRIGDQLFGGWALWYFIGTTPDGVLVCGYETINTTSNLLTSKN
ncbi:MAG: hypothetical protein AAF489_02585 [Bacteroidota bacterium]